MEEEEAGEAELVDEPELVLEPPLRLAWKPCRLVSICTWVVAILERVPADRASWRIAGSLAVREVGVAVAELLRQVELEPGSASSTVRSAARRSKEKRSSISAGARSTLSRLPRRSGSQPSSEVRQRIATSASWSSVRRGWWAWTSPVATVSTPRCSARSREQQVAARVAPLVRALELDEEAVRRRRPPGVRPRSGRRRRAPGVRSPRGRRAPRTAPRRARAAPTAGSGAASRAPARADTRARMRLGQQPAEIPVPRPRLDEQRHVRAFCFDAGKAGASALGRLRRCLRRCRGSPRRR